jgi:methionine sulfoxide reductase heme-binding subunit
VRADPTFWLLARASGLTAYALLTATVLMGLTVKSRVVKSAGAVDLHRFVAFVALGVLGLHGVSLALDRTVHLGTAALVVPGLSPYRPVAVALGVVALELAALLVLSFPLRRRIGIRAWRRLHKLAYLAFVAATVHGLAAGTDSARSWVFALYLSAVAAVTFATAARVLSPLNQAHERST